MSTLRFSETAGPQKRTTGVNDARLRERVAREKSLVSHGVGVRVGAVRYLNTRPLTFCLRKYAADVGVVFDHPSRLAADLAAARLDVAVAPSIVVARCPGARIVSNACVACNGPVRSVKLFGRVPVERIRTLALDEGSRTSAALVQILLQERCGLRPQLEPLPIGTSLEDATADAVLLIGDRGLRPPSGRHAFVWDLGEEWLRWTGLPFVFAMWIARPGADLGGFDAVLAAARDEGVSRLAEIARQEAPALGISEADCLGYLRDNLSFELGPRQRQGLELFFELAGRHGLAPPGADLAPDHPESAR